MPGLLTSLGLSSALGGPTLPLGQKIQGPLPWGNTGGTGAASFTPNNPLSVVNSPLFYQIDLDGNLWDKLVPYRLVVWDTENDIVVGGNDPSPITINPLGNGTLAFTPMSTAWEFFLPITPNQLSITDTYSINTSATLRGILEEHSGVRFKNIVVQGTFGVWPGRPSTVNPPGTPNILQSVFAGTIGAAQNVATQFQSILNNVTNGSNASKPTTIRPGDPKDLENGLGTGYYQTMLLTQFLEQYAEAKRNPANAAWRLVFDIPKQNQSFVVTPVGFTWNENANRPMEINYNIQFKAWRRIDLAAPTQPAKLQVTPLGPGVLQNLLNTIQAAQNTAAAAYNLIGSVRSDVDTILNVIRQTGILVKQLAGVALAVSDLPAQLVTDAQSTIANFSSTLNINNLTGPAATDPDVQALLGGIQGLAHIREGISPAALANGQIGPSAIATYTLNQSSTAFTNPLQNPMLFSQVPVNSLQLNTAQQNALQNELNTVSNFTVANLKTMRATILTLCTQLETSFGAGNAYYSTLFNTPPPITTELMMTLDQYDILQSFYELVESYDILTATNQLDNNQILNNMEYVDALATTSGIEFSIPNSKIQVPVPAGLNMEQIAQRYLGDSQRWLEIATLNFLQEPYIDNDGFQYPLLSNADGRSIVVEYNDDLYIGQTIYLYANGQTPTARTIINIVTLSTVSFLLTLDGPANLDLFTTGNQAYLQGYLPGTVNGQNVIWIPSDIQTTTDDQITIPSSVANVDLVGLSKVSWLLTPQGDLAINNSGDFQLAAGLPNLVQALNIKFSTPLGSDLSNPTFGLGVKPGTMVSDTSASDIYNQITNLITADPRFSNVSGLQVSITPPSMVLNLAVGLSGIQGVFPVSFQLPTYGL